MTRQGVVPDDLVAVRGQPLGERVQGAHLDPRVALAGRTELRNDAQVHLHPAAPEPAAAAGGQDRGLGQLGHAQDAVPEGAALVLGAGRDVELHVVQAFEGESAGHEPPMVELSDDHTSTPSGDTEQGPVAHYTVWR